MNSAPSARAFSQPAASFCRFAAKSPMVELSWSRPIFNGTRIVAVGAGAKFYYENRVERGAVAQNQPFMPAAGEKDFSVPSAADSTLWKALAKFFKYTSSVKWFW